MADRRGRVRHRRADRDGDPSEAVLRRLSRAQVPRERGWVPSAPAARPADPPVLTDPAAESGPPRTPTSFPSRWRDGLADRLPLTIRGALVRPSSTAVIGLAVLLLAAVALVGVLLWWSRPSDTAVPAVRREAPPGAAAPANRSTPSGPSSAPGASIGSTPAPSAGLVVHVTGAVRRPGLVELPGGSRVADAVEAAGGPSARADLSSVNLARPLVDGEQLVVLRHGQAGAAVAGAAGPTGLGGDPSGVGGPPGAPIDLNTATLQQLDGLPGVGPVLAQRITDWRTEHGRFTSVDELTEVSGIGEKTLADLRSAVRV